MICWQYQIKESQITTEDVHLRDLITSNETIVRPLDYNAAKKFILKYEWLGNMGYGNICFGLFFKNILLATVVFGPHLASRIRLPDSRYLDAFQIHRGASAPACPKWGPSRLIRQAINILHDIYGINLVYSYADPLAGEIGTIYQACGALYLGQSDPGGAKYIWIDGQKFHPRAVYRKFGSRSLDYLKSWGLTVRTENINKKHKYLFVLGDSTTKKKLLEVLQKEFKPYPKRYIEIAS